MRTVQQSAQIRFEPSDRSSDHHDDVILPAYQVAWRDAAQYASKRTYAHADYEVRIEMDWSAFARRKIEEVEALKRREDGPLSSDWTERLHRDVLVPATVTVTSADAPTNELDCAVFLRYHIANVFLAMNLSAPGCCNLRSRGEGSEVRIYLEAYDFEWAWHASLDGRGPPVGAVPLQQCFKWLAPLEKRFVHVARSRLERVAVALLQVAGMNASPHSAVWLWYTLEALFRPAPRDIFRQVHGEVCKLLGANAAQSSMLEQSLRPLYKLRSRFTHGQIPVIHPYSADEFGEDADNEIVGYADAHIAGFNTLLACAQAFARRA